MMLVRDEKGKFVKAEAGDMVKVEAPGYHPALAEIQEIPKIEVGKDPTENSTEVSQMTEEYILKIEFQSSSKDDKLTPIPVKTILIGANDSPMVNIPEPTKEMKRHGLKVDCEKLKVFKRVI